MAVTFSQRDCKLFRLEKLFYVLLQLIVSSSEWKTEQGSLCKYLLFNREDA